MIPRAIQVAGGVDLVQRHMTAPDSLFASDRICHVLITVTSSLRDTIQCALDEIKYNIENHNGFPVKSNDLVIMLHLSNILGTSARARNAGALVAWRDEPRL